MYRIESPIPSFKPMVTLMYWTLFVLAACGLLGSIYSVLNGKWGSLMVCVGIMFPYCAMWVIDYGNNTLIRKETEIVAKVVSQGDVVDGRKVVLRLTPHPHMFYTDPTEASFSVFGSIDDRPVKIISMTAERGVDRLITAVNMEIFVPNVGASSIRLDEISFGNRTYAVKGELLDLGHHYAYE